MNIIAQSRGGFAGVGERLAVDTALAANGRAIDAQIAALQGLAPPAAVGADIMHWDITVDGGRQLAFDDDASPDSAPWQQLIALLRSAA